MRIKKKDKQYTPILIGIMYVIYFYTFCKFTYQKGWLMSLKAVSISNIVEKLINDFGTMLIFPLAIIIVYRKKLNELSVKRSKIAIVLSLIYILFFVLHGNYTVNGIYKAFFYLFVIAIPEEIIYRGYIYNNFKKHNRMFAIIVSGILFGIMHAILPSIIAEDSLLIMIKEMFNQIGGGIFGGFIFIVYLEKSDSIFVPILIHALLDYSYGVLGILVAIIVLVYLLIMSKKNEEKHNVTKKCLIEEENLFENNSRS